MAFHITSLMQFPFGQKQISQCKKSGECYLSWALYRLIGGNTVGSALGSVCG